MSDSAIAAKVTENNEDEPKQVEDVQVEPIKMEETNTESSSTLEDVPVTTVDATPMQPNPEDQTPTQQMYTIQDTPPTQNQTPYMEPAHPPVVSANYANSYGFGLHPAGHNDMILLLKINIIIRVLIWVFSLIGWSTIAGFISKFCQFGGCSSVNWVLAAGILCWLHSMFAGVTLYLAAFRTMIITDMIAKLNFFADIIFSYIAMSAFSVDATVAQVNDSLISASTAFMFFTWLCYAICVFQSGVLLFNLDVLGVKATNDIPV